MAKIKSFTSLEQSRKLAEFLPIESADLYYDVDFDKDYHIKMPTNGYFGNKRFFIQFPEKVPCWSLSALLDVLPNNEHITTTLSRGGWKIEPVEYIDKWFCEYEEEVDEDNPCRGFTFSADNPVDACFDMIIKLKENELI